MSKISKIKFFSAALAFALLSACAAPELAQPSAGSDTAEITIFSLNDFHGNLQADQPVPYMAPMAEVGAQAVHAHTHGAAPLTTASGGYAYLAALLKQRRLAAPDNILVAAGDLIGASPLGSAILRDEPVIEALNQLALSVTSLGNHEFDNGALALLGKLKGECPAAGCAFPGFSGAKYDTIAANVTEKNQARPWLKPYVIRQIGDVKVAFIGAVTADVPNLVAGDGVKNLRFEDEAAAINRYVPEILQQGVAAIVVLIHEGAHYAGAANDPSYRCEGLQGPIIEIVKKLDKAISLVVSGHSHQAYTCKIDGKLLVQARSYGAYLTESTLSIQRSSNMVVKAVARNHLVEQRSLTPDPQAQRLVDQVATLTDAVRSRPVASIGAPLMRASAKASWDSRLGNVIADAQLSFARQSGAADVAFINAGSIRSDLPGGSPAPGVPVTFGDLYAAQPFGNSLLRMRLSGTQLLQLLQQQWRNAEHPNKLFVSQGFSYRWNPAATPENRVQQVLLNGQPLQPERRYTVIVNSFLAGGGDGFTVLKDGTERQNIGQDIQAFEAYVRQQGTRLSDVKTDRVQRAE